MPQPTQLSADCPLPCNLGQTGTQGTIYTSTRLACVVTSASAHLVCAHPLQATVGRPRLDRRFHCHRHHQQWHLPRYTALKGNLGRCTGFRSVHEPSPRRLCVWVHVVAMPTAMQFRHASRPVSLCHLYASAGAGQQPQTRLPSSPSPRRQSIRSSAAIVVVAERLSKLDVNVPALADCRAAC